MIVAAIVSYVIVGALCGGVAFHQHRTPIWMIFVWTALWPLLFVFARITNPPADMDRPYGWREVNIYVGTSIGAAALAILIAAMLSVDVERPLFALSGVGLVICTQTRPHWFWNHPRTKDFRVLLGHGLTIAAFTILGLVLMWVGLFTEVTVLSD